MRVDRCFAFLDLSGFTAYTEEHGDEEAVSVLAMTRSVVRRAAERRGVRVTKWMGDGVMLSSAEAGGIAACVLEARHHLTGASPLDVRGGVARGKVIMFEGDDYIGSTINLASRLCDVAEAGQILVAVSSDIVLPPWASTSPVGAVTVAGVRRPVEVEALEILRTPGRRPVVDPVCGVPIDVAVGVRPEGLADDDPTLCCSADCAGRWLAMAERRRAPRGTR
ncbi:MAG: adenylate/guanylate cyclase domain-containing protein [Solirubrobacteraceae bacterium]|nr:adenylate/guanylate cyclase domain-containing protein [Solirubrobacteraceae bacterium]